MRSVYVIAAEGGGVKIGTTKSPDDRLRQLQTGHFVKLTMVQRFENADAFYIERVAHALLKEKRALGEWFSVSEGEAGAAIAEAIRLVENGEAIAMLRQDRKPRKQYAYKGASKSFSFRVNQEFLGALDDLCVEWGMNRSEVVRECVHREHQKLIASAAAVAALPRKIKGKA